MNPMLERAAIGALGEEGAEWVTKKLLADVDVDDLTYLEGRIDDEVSWSLTALGLELQLVHRHRSCLFSVYLASNGERGKIVQRLTDLPGPAFA